MPFYPKSVTNRVEEVDFLRGIAIVFMVIFHWYVLYDLRHGTSTLGHPVLTVLGFVARVLFIFLVGVATALAQQKAQLREDNGEQDEREFLRRQYRRVGYLALYALLVTLVTAWVYPDVYVRFGILHYMAVALALLTLFAYKPQTIGKTLPLVVGLVMYFVHHSVKNTVSYNYASQFIMGYLPHYGTMDYFPLFKWFWLTALGLFVGQSLFKKAQPIYTSLEVGENMVGKGLVTLGKYSLEIYLTHFVVIYGVQQMMGLVANIPNHDSASKRGRVIALQHRFFIKKVCA